MQRSSIEKILLELACESAINCLSLTGRTFSVACALGDRVEYYKKALLNSKAIEKLITISTSCGNADVIGNANQLPLKLHSIDAAFCCMLVQPVNELSNSILQIKKVIKPNGLFFYSFIGGNTLIELRQSLTQAEKEITGKASERIPPFLTIHNFGDLLHSIGFANPVTDRDRITDTYDSIHSLLTDIKVIGLANLFSDAIKQPDDAVMLRASEIYSSIFSGVNNQLYATFDIMHGLAWIRD